MSGSFIAIFLIALAMLAFWRITLAVATALLIAMLLTGINDVAAWVQPTETVSVPAPDRNPEPPMNHPAAPPR